MFTNIDHNLDMKIFKGKLYYLNVMQVPCGFWLCEIDKIRSDL